MVEAEVLLIMAEVQVELLEVQAQVAVVQQQFVEALLPQDREQPTLEGAVERMLDQRQVIQVEVVVQEL